MGVLDQLGGNMLLVLFLAVVGWFIAIMLLQLFEELSRRSEEEDE